VLPAWILVFNESPVTIDGLASRSNMHNSRNKWCTKDGNVALVRRMAHIAAWTDVYRNWTFEDQSLGLPGFEVPGTRDDSQSGSTRLRSASAPKVRALDDAELVELRPTHYGSHLPIHRLVSGIAVEHIHHGASIGLLRDLDFNPNVGDCP